MNVNISDIFKLPSKVMLALSITSGAVLFLPNNLIEILYLLEFKDKYGFALGIIFISSIAILMCSAAFKLFPYFKKLYNFKTTRRAQKKALYSLTTYQNNLLYLLYLKDNFTGELPINDGAVLYLEQYKIIGKATSQYLVNMHCPKFPYFIQPWVIDILNKDIKLIEIIKKSASNPMDKKI